MAHGLSIAAQKLLDRQEVEPVFMTDGCGENALADTPTTGFAVFERLGLAHGKTDHYHNVFHAPHGAASVGANEAFYPLTPFESNFVGEDDLAGPFAGIVTGYSFLYQGRKYIGPTTEVCYDGPGRPFSIKSYGDAPDAIYPDENAALEQANRLADSVRRKLLEIGGDAFVLKASEIDRHAVIFLVPVEYLTAAFDTTPKKAHSAYTAWLRLLVHNFKPKPAVWVTKTPGKAKKPTAKTKLKTAQEIA